ncbi:hypothetical protein J7E50_07680 [Pedobacter sp. ISL-68]|nr:hypothetical protein [Pedobacter sp. ISL-64]MBT2590090.1 hypothetical protein [Pedobacter sp. ISL-68]
MISLIDGHMIKVAVKKNGSDRYIKRLKLKTT